MRYIFVTGGVISSLGKGLLTACVGRLLKDRGIRVTLLKIDPYINIDPGTLSPYQHGEVYVTDDGAETDLDLGHYERFVEIKMSKINNITTGQIYYEVIRRERRGEYNGKTVQVVPHIIDEIIRRIRQVGTSGKYDVVIVELGGTIGDIESQPFTEAFRQMKLKSSKDKFLHIHLVLVPYIPTAGELKTKPAQHSVKKLNELGLQPDILACRSVKPLPGSIKSKLSLFCNVDEKSVINAVDVDNIYEIPINFKKEGLDKLIIEKLELKPVKDDKTWEDFIIRIKKIKKEVYIGLVGKYTELHDAYKSVIEALKHGGWANNVNTNIIWINSEGKIEERVLNKIKGILVPGGFGERGIEGKIEAVKIARERKIPFLGLCLGMQCAVIEFARNVIKLEDANSTEFKKDCKNPVIDIIPEKKDEKDIGGTLRRGGYNCKIKKNTLAYKIYKKELIRERHRHRFEFNNKYRTIFEKHGMIISGINPEQDLVEIVEYSLHPFFIGVQFHPEFLSRPLSPHPLFKSFIEYSLFYSQSE